MNGSAVTVILVEDDPGHARLIIKNLKRSGICNEITIFNNGKSALDFIESRSESEIAQLLILLDINLPVMDGIQVLQRLKGNEATRRIPVVMLTTTDNPIEVKRCYQYGCNVYVTKPIDPEQFTRAICSLGMFISIVKIPSTV